MRLTLRTLLAYLDDVLDPAQTREIGQKIRETPRAAALMSRIREVIRRRRLGAPDLNGSGQGLDPNLVAEYLDNVLTPEQVVEVERICLESDVQLAEVAACHQILTLVLSETPEVSQLSLDRYYALGPVAPEDRMEEVNGAEPVRPPEVPAATATDATTEFVARLPDYLKPAPWSQRVAPAAGVALLILLAIALLAMDRDLFRGLRGIGSAQQEVARAPENAVPQAEVPSRPPSATREVATLPTPPAETPTPSPAVSPPTATAAATPATTRGTLKSLPVGIDPAPPPDAPEPLPAKPSGAVGRPGAEAPSATPPSATPPSATPQPATPQPATPPSATPPSATPQPATPQPATPQPAPPHSATTTVAATPGAATPAPRSELPPSLTESLVPRVQVPMQYTSLDGVLLRYEPGDAHWYVLPRRSELHAEETFACPEPFEAQFDIDRGAFKVRLLGDTWVDVLPVSDAARQGLRVRRGRVILQGGAGDAPERNRFALQIGSQAWRLTLTRPDTVCGVEVHWREPVGFEMVYPGDSGLVAALTVANGALQLEGVKGESQEVQAGRRIDLIGPWMESLPPAATWLDAQRYQAGEPLRRFAPRFERQFDATLAIDLSIPAVAKDPHPKLAELATRCLALLGNQSALAQTLAESEHEEARTAAIRGLRLWLGQDRERAPLLKQELENRYSEAEAAAVYRLLWGLRPEEGKDKILSVQLIELLNHNRVEIRELAFEQIVKLTGKKYEYLPLSSSSRRAPAIQRWRQHLEREGGALLRSE